MQGSQRSVESSGHKLGFLRTGRSSQSWPVNVFNLVASIQKLESATFLKPGLLASLELEVMARPTFLHGNMDWNRPPIKGFLHIPTSFIHNIVLIDITFPTRV